MTNIILLQSLSTMWEDPWWLLWTLIAFLLGALMYWLLFCRKKQQIIDELTAERDGLHAQLTNAEKDLASLKYQLDEANKEVSRLKAALNSCEADKSILSSKLAAATEGDGGDGGGDAGIARGIAGGTAGDGGGAIDFGALLGSDNLQIVEGVGPKIEGLLKDGGIGNWGAFGGASVDRLQEILDAAGSRYKLANPKTWPQQAKLADEGKWDELIEYQKFLDAGVETKGDFDTPAKVEKMIVKILGFSLNEKDLKVVEGIGPKIEGLLKEAGVNNWTDLANASMDTLKGVLEAAGSRYRLADPTTWPKQAGMAAAGDWAGLKAYQDALDGGRA